MEKRDSWLVVDECEVGGLAPAEGGVAPLAVVENFGAVFDDNAGLGQDWERCSGLK